MSAAIASACQVLKIDIYTSRLSLPKESIGQFRLPHGQALLPCPYLCLVGAIQPHNEEAVLSLLQNVLVYLNIPNHLCCVVLDDPVNGGVSQADLLKVVSPKVLLNFGFDAAELQVPGSVQVIESQNLEKALHAPMLKEKILRDVYPISL